jgi:hypothetical protein
MFYCKVLVGDSQKWKGQHNSKVKDTEYKDTIKKIRF